MTSAAERLATVYRKGWSEDVHFLLDMGLYEKGFEDLLAADPALADAIELGLAWQEAWAAVDTLGLEDAYVAFQGIRRSQIGMKDKWVASFEDEGGYFNFYGDTPAEALRALAAKLQENSNAAR